MKDWESTVSFLEADMKTLHEEYLRNVQRLQDTIADLRRRYGKKVTGKTGGASEEPDAARERRPRGAGRATRKASARPQTNQQTDTAPGSGKPDGQPRRRRRRASGEVPISHLLDEAAAAQPGDFTLADLRSHLDANHAEQAATITNDELSKYVYALRQGKRPKILLVRQPTTKGGMNTYRYNHPQNPGKK